MNDETQHHPFAEVTEQHVWHHQEQAAPRINITLEKNTKGYNFSVVVVNAADPDQALDMLEQARSELAAKYGEDAQAAKVNDLTAKLEAAQADAVLLAQRRDLVNDSLTEKLEAAQARIRELEACTAEQLQPSSMERCDE